MTATTAGTSPAARGSAYVVTLLALMVLTMLAMSVVLLSQSEMQIGANERIIQRVFYAADSGVAATTARALVDKDFSAHTLVLPEPDGSSLAWKSEVALSALVPILDAPCNLCEINNAGSYSDNAYRRVNHALTVRAVRRGGAEETQTASKTLAAMIDLQPWRDPPQAYLVVDDPEALTEIEF